MDRLRVIDAHVHFWNPSVLRYPWLASEPALASPFLPSDFGPLVMRSGARGFVPKAELSGDRLQELL